MSPVDVNRVVDGTIVSYAHWLTFLDGKRAEFNSQVSRMKRARGAEVPTAASPTPGNSAWLPPEMSDEQPAVGVTADDEPAVLFAATDDDNDPWA